MKDRKFLTNRQIELICINIADKINRDIYLQEKEVLFICTLKGALPFFNMVCGMLNPMVSADVEIEFIQPSSFTKNERGEVNFKGFDFNINNKIIYIFEDILDSYNTIRRILDFPIYQTPFAVTVVSLLGKPNPSPEEWPNVNFIIGSLLQEDCPFLYGFGLDDNQKCRLLPDIYIK